MQTLLKDARVGCKLQHHWQQRQQTLKSLLVFLSALFVGLGTIFLLRCRIMKSIVPRVVGSFHKSQRQRTAKEVLGCLFSFIFHAFVFFFCCATKIFCVTITNYGKGRLWFKCCVVCCGCGCANSFGMLAKCQQLPSDALKGKA